MVLADNLQQNATYVFRLMDTITDNSLNPFDGEFDGRFPTGDGVAGGNFNIPILTNQPADAIDDIYIVEETTRHGFRCACE